MGVDDEGQCPGSGVGTGVHEPDGSPRVAFTASGWVEMSYAQKLVTPDQAAF